ncbi:MAG: DUF3644 domain-containing protein [Candidatus Margulisbacteria bacterium]|nr:DUF3644 domain-containing protein [Candidatus Margulisiibacteriota bacterium]
MRIRKSPAKNLLEKSIAAAISAIEIYNKPDFKYREETFSILLINAFELLFKAKLLHDNKNSFRCIYVLEHTTNAYGKKSKLPHPKRNRCGNFMTIGVEEAYKRLIDSNVIPLNERCQDNLKLLIEIRDNSIHYLNKDLYISLKVQEIGTAALKNFLNLINHWFDYDLSQYNFYLMPLTFFHETEAIESFSVSSYNKQTQNLLKYLSELETKHPSDAREEYNLTLKVETRFVKASTPSAFQVRYTDDPNAPEMRVSEELLNLNYPWDYGDLTNRLSNRYTDFLLNLKYHRIRRKIEQNKKLCNIRYLDPGNPKSSKKKFYNPNILKEFDKHYKKK